MLVLPTQPSFLRGYQSHTREALLGISLLSTKQVLSEVWAELGFVYQLWLANIDKPTNQSSLVVSLRRLLFYKTRPRSIKLRLVRWCLVLTLVVGLVGSFAFFAPDLYYRVFSVDQVVLTPEKPTSVLGGDYQLGAQAALASHYQPDYDPSLPDGDWLVIEQIGVRTPLRVTADFKEAIKKGVWLDPSYGLPGDKKGPIILAAHRFGYKWWWKSDYWKKNSFYKLPETKPGTIVKLISNHRLWQYEIYRAEEGEYISDYDADLILYTCKFLNSPVRYFRYARLINPEKDSQANLGLSQVKTSPARH